MFQFSSLSIRRKIQLGFGCISIFCVVIAVIATLSLSRVNRSTEEIDNNWMPSIRLIADLRFQMTTMHRSVLNHVMCDSAECEQRYLQLFHQSQDEYTRLRQGYNRYITSDSEKAIAAEIDENMAKYAPLAEQAMSISSSGKKEDAGEFVRKNLRSPYENLASVLNKDIALNNNGADEAAHSAEDTYRSSRTVLFVSVAVILVLSLILAAWIANYIARPLQEAVIVLERVADKDLTQTLDVRSEDEVGKMARALNTMTESLRKMMSEIYHSAEELSSATMQITAAANQTSSSTREQAQHVQQVAVASQEMVSVIADISQNTEQAALASTESAKRAQDGGMVVREAADNMEKISRSNAEIVAKIERLGNSSQQIGKVISVIQDIAEQTNLLALNAAIESARAGEHGRGFAVVAGEVRRLAERTRKSSEEIVEMVALIQSETNEALQVTEGGKNTVISGMKKAHEAGSALDQIIAQAQSAGELVSLVATAATEQRSASAEVNESMERISQMIEEASSAAVQTAQSCEGLSRLATNLERTVSQFKVA